jgi:2TM domain
MRTDEQSGLEGKMTDRAQVLKAHERLAALKGFYIHLLVFTLVVAGLFVINAASTDDWWAQWVLFGWGVGILAHAIAVFWQKPRVIAQWEKRKLREFLGR